MYYEREMTKSNIFNIQFIIRLHDECGSLCKILFLDNFVIFPSKPFISLSIKDFEMNF